MEWSWKTWSRGVTNTPLARVQLTVITNTVYYHTIPRCCVVKIFMTCFFKGVLALCSKIYTLDYLEYYPVWHSSSHNFTSCLKFFCAKQIFFKRSAKALPNYFSRVLNGYLKIVLHVKLAKTWSHEGLVRCEMKLKIIASPSFNSLCGPLCGILWEYVLRSFTRREVLSNDSPKQLQFYQ